MVARVPMTARSSNRSRLLLVGAVWALLFLGVFVLHGVSSHGATAHAPPSTGELLGTAQSDGHSGEDKPAPGPEQAQHAMDGEPGGHSAAELCLAILIGFLSVLAALRVGTRPRRPQFKVPRRAARAMAPSWLRSPNPPCLIRLSIQRC